MLWAIDSRCPRGADPNDVVACPELYDTRVAGITLVAAGAASAVAGGVMLVVESLHAQIPKGYIYFAMAFSLTVELLNMRLRKVTKPPVRLHQSYVETPPGQEDAYGAVAERPRG